jgi:hypothetical protein
LPPVGADQRVCPLWVEGEPKVLLLEGERAAANPPALLWRVSRWWVPFHFTHPTAVEEPFPRLDTSELGCL